MSELFGPTVMEEFGADIRSRLKGVKWKNANDYCGFKYGHYCFLYTGKHLGMPTLAFVCEREFIALRRCTPSKFHENSNVWLRSLHTAFIVSPRPHIALRLILDRCEANTFNIEDLILPEPEHEEAPDT